MILILMELTQRNAELDEMMGTFNDISEGFRQINAAESRVDLQRGAVAEGSLNAKQQIASDIEFIRKQMEENKVSVSLPAFVWSTLVYEQHIGSALSEQR